MTDYKRKFERAEQELEVYLAAHGPALETAWNQFADAREKNHALVNENERLTKENERLTKENKEQKQAIATLEESQKATAGTLEEASALYDQVVTASETECAELRGVVAALASGEHADTVIRITRVNAALVRKLTSLVSIHDACAYEDAVSEDVRADSLTADLEASVLGGAGVTLAIDHYLNDI